MSEARTYEVLLVEDSPADARLTMDALRSVAGPEEFALNHVTTFGAALDALQVGQYDIVLLDLMLPDARFLEAAGRLTEDRPELPIIILSGIDDERLSLDAVLNGVQDYLIKGQTSPGVLRRTMRHAIERKRVERELERLAKYDPLTGLCNRVVFRDQLAQALRRGAGGEEMVALLYLDLDGFKEVNDQFGHAVGDRLLAAVAERLIDVLRRTDAVARLGGDEFTIVLENLAREGDAIRVADKLIARIAEPFDLAGREIRVRASVGVAIATPATTCAESLLEQADAAMYRAKGDGGHGWHLAVMPVTASEGRLQGKPSPAIVRERSEPRSIVGQRRHQPDDLDFVRRSQPAGSNPATNGV